MSIIWFFMMLLSSIILFFTNPGAVVSSLLDSSASAVNLCISLLGIYSVWLGLINILDKSGLSDKLANLLKPIINFLFKTDNPTARKYIAINLSSNILGLGNAATPSGIKAMQELDNKTGKLTFAGVMLLVINSCSIQILPTTIIGLRESAGSVSSTDIILPIIISSLLTCIFAILLVFSFDKLKRRKKRWAFIFCP